MTADVYSNNVSFTYEHADEPALIDITLSIASGQCIVLCGASGCGKTTYSRIVNGLIPQFFHGECSGAQRTCGLDTAIEPIDGLTPLVGSVFQNPKTQYFNAKVIDELSFPAENMGLPPEAINKRIAKTARRFSIEPLLNRSIFHLSGGQKQRIALAAATMLSPRLLVLDEPTSNLDAVAIEKMRELVAQLKAAGMTIVVAEHRLAWLNGIADRYLVFDNGRIAHEYEAAEFLALSPGCIGAMGLRALDLQPYRQRIAQLESQTASSFSESPTPLLSTRNLSIGYRGRDGFTRTIPDLDFHAGQIIGLMGHNGCGKTTLVRTLTGLIKPASGTVLLNGKPAKPRELTRAGFLVMQDVNYQLFSDSVREELLLGLDESDPANTKHCNQVLEDLDLTRFADRHPMSLSGGQKQRVAIGSALMCGKDLIILDEPTSGLDRYHMEHVGELLRQLAAQGKTVLVVTHDEELAAGWCTDIINLEHNEDASKTNS
ncbi:ABC transporter ATP-binding protein [Bifidobacterium cebidarum]|uniref:ABC transporter ATP-binding protein n=1 Tax=Bifidobacterium cebidarum TaxID=2650773 RepID=A0A6I1GFN5_9BIFI|nr:energy-coupling factor ABC transporter ATP-binding protein [Bifidobacterium cebidarum]KAB7788337.1 ABC transporter ATP-binding protein [Bifidobacterium cebidarum]